MTWLRNSTAFSEDDQGYVLYPFGKFINQHEYELEVTWCWLEGSNHILALARKGLGGWYGLDLMG
jgi:hypothetical protein